MSQIRTQTAVDWLVNQIFKSEPLEFLKEIEEAKEIERKQIKNAFDCGKSQSENGNEYFNKNHYS